MPKTKTKKTVVKKVNNTQNDLLTALVAQVTMLSQQVKELKSEKAESPTVRRADGKIVTKTSVAAPKQVVDEGIKARYELWSYDEYNQGSIVSAGPRLDKVVEAAKRFVTEQNVDNALAAGEKDKSWEAYWPQVYVDGEPTNEVLYAGNKRDGKHYVYVKGEDKWELRKPDASVQFRFYLGQTSNGRVKSDWLLTNYKGKEITSLTDQALERKTVLFVKVISK